MRIRICAVLLVLALPIVGGCLMPRRGTPAFVDMRAGAFWSGEGLLLEASEDGRRCRVAVRDRALIVRRRWVDCVYVHSLGSRP